MFKFRLLAAFAAVSMAFSPAFAKENGRGKEVWMSGSSAEEITAELQRGNIVCVGAKKPLGTCMSLNTYFQEVTVQTISRPPGANKNVVVVTIASVGSDGGVVRNEGGVIVARFQVASENANWQATMQQMVGNILPAALNGVGAAGVQAAFPACGGNRCGGQGVINVVTANSGSVAQSNAALNAVLSGSGCGTGACTPPPTPPTGH